MARFLLISQDGDGLGIARRIHEEGHDVYATIRNPKAKHDYDGLLKKIDKSQFGSILTRQTTIIFDSNGGGKTADRLRGEGYPVVGSSMFADQLELDRHLALQLMQEAGIKVPPSKHFTDYQSGIQYTKQRGERMCFKSDNNKTTSYVSSCPEDMIEFLQAQEKEGEKPDFELQDFVKGLEISTEIWFDGYEMSPPANHTFERKQLMNDDLGPSSGCAGNVVWACNVPMCRICEEGVKKFIPMLRHHGYSGMIDLNAIVNDDGVWGLEWTPRTGYDAFPALMEMLTEGVGDILAKYASGVRVKDFPLRDKGFGAALRVTIPPYPFDEAEAPKGVPIRDLVRADRMHSYFYNVLLDDSAQLRSSGAFGAIAAFTSFGDDIYSAIGKCEEIAKRVGLRDKQFRTDLGLAFEGYYQKYQSLTTNSADMAVPVAVGE